MPLDLGSLIYPNGSRVRAQQIKNQNQEEAFQNLGSFGESLGTIGQTLATKKAIDDLMKANSNQQSATPTALEQKNNLSMPSEHPQQSQSQADPMMQTMLPLLRANPAMLPQVLPALIRASHNNKTSGLNPFQDASLKERKRQFDIRQKETENYHQNRILISTMLEEAVKTKNVLMAKHLKAGLADLDARHNVLYGLGMMESPSEAAGEIPEADDSEEGWGPVQVNP